MSKSILIIDDNVKLCKSLSRNFEHLGYSVFNKFCSNDAMEHIKRYVPEVVLLDVALGDESGIDLLNEIKLYNHFIPVIMITGYGTIEIAVKAIKLGAFDFIQKPLEFNKLLVIVENAIKMRSLNMENINFKNKISSLSRGIVSSNKKILEILKKANKLANTDLPVLIQGESGTGKEGLAEYIHNNSNRSSKDLVKINCSAFPENLLDNELFGHEKGAYTGAHTKFKGVFEKADGGTLLLDEIGDMSLQTQAKILRTLQNNEIRRIGSEENTIINVRFIASTNKDLKELIKQNLFREDLYYRLSTATLYLPPLSERIDDIPLLVEHFLEDINKNRPSGNVECTEDFLKILIDHNWRGNIRELKNIVNYSAAICMGNKLGIEDLPPTFLGDPQVKVSYDLIKDNEKGLIIKTLQKTNNNKKATSEILKISRKTLYNKMEKYGIS
ncbi:MAG: sigma-54-dependent Fis family transcriptional regulator [Spirochaetales bacterium]|nr:sigma-54-dependent Fis family transcriptional regulator [Spirochaetales bacterium]